MADSLSAGDARALAAALEQLLGDGLVAFPTETVWGLGANARSERAVAALQRWKGRAPEQAISILVPSSGAAEALGISLPTLAQRLADRFWPGPLTLVVPGPLPGLARGVARADAAVGLRCSSHPVAAALVRAVEAAGLGPLTATSLNRSGEPAIAQRAEARKACDGRGAPHLLGASGEDAWGAQPSTVVDCCGRELRVLRPGAVSPQDIEAAMART